MSDINIFMLLIKKRYHLVLFVRAINCNLNMMENKSNIEMIGYNDSKAIGIYGNIKLFPVFIISLILSFLFLIPALLLKIYILSLFFVLPLFILLIIIIQYVINTKSKNFLEGSLAKHKFLLKNNVLYKDGVEIKSVNDICLYKFKNFLFLILKNSYYRINNSDFIVGSRDEFLGRIKYRKRRHIVFLLPKLNDDEKVNFLFDMITLKDKVKLFYSPDKTRIIYIYKNSIGSYSIRKEKMELATDEEVQSLGQYGWREEEYSDFGSYYDSLESALNDLKYELDSYIEMK